MENSFRFMQDRLKCRNFVCEMFLSSFVFRKFRVEEISLFLQSLQQIFVRDFGHLRIIGLSDQAITLLVLALRKLRNSSSLREVSATCVMPKQHVGVVICDDSE